MGATPQRIGIFEAKTRLSDLIARVERGRVFIIAKRGKPVAELRPLTPPKTPLERGCAKNEGYVMADDFNQTLTDFEDCF